MKLCNNLILNVKNEFHFVRNFVALNFLKLLYNMTPDNGLI